MIGLATVPDGVQINPRPQRAAGRSVSARPPSWRAILLLCGWLIATGAHWDIVQIVAWGRMWTQNLHTESAASALVTTFSPAGMCDICRAVQSAKFGQSHAAATLDQLTGKAPLLPVTASRVVVAAPALLQCIARFEPLVPREVHARPPVPPPRAWTA